MVFKFKFPMGSKVYKVSSNYEHDYVKCDTCDGQGYLAVPGYKSYECSATCPACRGRQTFIKARRMKWTPKCTPYIVAQVRVEITDQELDSWSKDYIKEEYMCHETGVGSGSLHKANSLFATYKEAVEHCEKENSRIDWEKLNEGF